MPPLTSKSAHAKPAAARLGKTGLPKKTPAKKPVDPAVPCKLALRGRVVTMDADGRVLADGCVYIEDGVIREIKSASAAPPAGFSASDITQTQGTIFPGLIELHNHLPYNILRLWQVPRLFTNRGQWGTHPDYALKVSGPMKVIGQSSELMPAVVRYVEAKCLIGGVTTSQGIALFSNAGSARYYRGIVRNVEQTSEESLPEALTRVADVEAKSIASFHARLKKSTCMLLHLSEGVDPTARKHFLALKEPDGDWAIERSLAGIHCAALQPADFERLADKQASMVWSPLSNLLLYQNTARIGAALDANLNVCLGSDWSPTGSKNLLCELKVASIWAEEAGLKLSAEEIVRMATVNPARALRWDGQLGSLEPEHKADLVVIDGVDGNEHEKLLRATERDVRLVVINGIPRHGRKPVMDALGISGERLTIGGSDYVLNFAQATSDPDVAALSLAKATKLLGDGLADLAKVADANKKASLTEVHSKAMGATAPRRWFLALDELQDTGQELRPQLELHGKSTAPKLDLAKAPTPKQLPSLTLDALSVVDDDGYLTALKNQTVLPDAVADKLRAFYP
jgi:cytosine/adenosine deaminase-related metal-dependent hydrolase